MSPLAGRHYVALGRRGLRRHLVMVTVQVPTVRHLRHATTLRYDIVSRHLTRRKAEQRARILNAQNGRAH